MAKIKYRETPCPGTACNWPYAGFHICLNQSLELMTRVEDGRPRRIRQATTHAVDKPQRVVGTMRQQQSADPKRVERNAEILRLYKHEGKTMREIAQQMDLNDSTVMHILHTAADKGDVVIRRAVRRSSKV